MNKLPVGNLQHILPHSSYSYRRFCRGLHYYIWLGYIFYEFGCSEVLVNSIHVHLVNLQAGGYLMWLDAVIHVNNVLWSRVPDILVNIKSTVPCTFHRVLSFLWVDYSIWVHVASLLQSWVQSFTNDRLIAKYYACTVVHRGGEKKAKTCSIHLLSGLIFQTLVSSMFFLLIKSHKIFCSIQFH